MPPPIWRRELAKDRNPDLSYMLALADLFEVSKETAAQAYAQYHEETLALVIVKDGTVNRVYRDPARFPRLAVPGGSAVPKSSLCTRATRQLHRVSAIVEAQAEHWLESEWGRSLPQLYEQVFFQQNGFALVMLWAEVADEEEEDGWGEKTSKQRLPERQERWRR